MTVEARLDALSQQVAALQNEVRGLRSQAEIERLIVAYARACDRGNDPLFMRPLFSPDATWECKGFGRYVGRDQVVGGLYAIAGEKIWWSLHYMISPMIDLADDGESATAFWYLWEPSTIPNEVSGTAEAVWIGATYQAALRRIDGQWLFSAIDLMLNMASPLSEGWVNKRFPQGTLKQPYFVTLEPGSYQWCACGRSATPPFCDNSHAAGGGKQPMAFVVDEPGLKVLCGCRTSKTKPWCDGSHLNLKL